MSLRATGNEITLESAGIGPGGLDPDITVLSNGNLVVTWSEILSRPTDEFDDVDGAIFARILTADGVPVSEIVQINTFSPYVQDHPHVVALTGGGFAVGYTSTLSPGDGPSDADILIRSFGADGRQTGTVSIDLVVDGPTGANGVDQILQEIVPLDDSRFAVLQQGGGAAVFTIGGGRTAGPAGFVDDMVQLANGNIVTAAVAQSQISLTLYDSKFGTPTGFEGIYAPLTFVIEGTSNTKADGNVELASLTGGGFALAYVEGIGAEDSSITVSIINDFAQKQGDAQQVVTRSFLVNSDKAEFDMIGLSDGRFAMAITDPDVGASTLGVDILLFDSNGELEDRMQASVSDSGNQENPVLTELPDGRIVLGFTDDSGNHSAHKLAYYKVAGVSGRFVGSSGDDTLAGLGGNDRILGLDGNDTISGGSGNDRLLGGSGNDSLNGGAGADALRGGDGQDTLLGGGGNDGLGGGAGDDTIKGGGGIDVIGGGLGNDRLFGNGGNDLLKGGQGDDVMSGGAGKDTFHFVLNQSGDDRITDFDASQDVLLIDLRGADSSVIDVTNSGGNTLVTFEATSVTLTGVVLDESDIVFQFL